MAIIKYLLENLDMQDLKIGTTMYRVDDVDIDEFNYMSKIMEKERVRLKNYEQDIKNLKNGWLTQDTGKDIKSIEVGIKNINNWDNKVKPWMIKILKYKNLQRYQVMRRSGDSSKKNLRRKPRAKHL